jgi:hypothetical protein
MRQRWQGWWVVALWLGLLWAWLGQHPVLNSDALYLFDLADGLFKGRRGLLWDLPQAPSFFPDLGVVWAIRLLVPAPQACLRFYGLCMGLWAWSALDAFQCAWLGLEPGGSRPLAALGLVLALLLAAPQTALNAWLLPGHHGSAFIASLMLGAWGLRQFRGPQAWSCNFLAAGLAGLLLGSDAFFGLWGLAPLLWLGWRSGAVMTRRGWLAVGVLAMACLLMLALPSLAGARVSSLPFRLLADRGWRGQAAALEPLGGILADSGALLVVVGLALALVLIPGRGRVAGGRAWSGGVLLAFLMTLWVMAFMGSVNGRYLYLAGLLPLWLLPALAVERWGPIRRAVPVILGMVGLAALAFVASAPQSVPLERRQAAWLDGVLAKRGLSFGWADYWSARPLRLFSQGATLTVPVIADGAGQFQPYFWIGDRSLFLADHFLEEPQFVVQNGLDEASLRRQMGQPHETLQGEGLRVLIYGDRSKKP